MKNFRQPLFTGNLVTLVWSVLLSVLLLAGIESFAQPIAAGGDHSVLLCSSSLPRSSGYNAYGQLGDGTATNRSTPVSVSSLSVIASVQAGTGHSLFLKSDGTVWASGHNNHGQLGDGTTANKSIPVQVISLSGIIAVSARGD